MNETNAALAEAMVKAYREEREVEVELTWSVIEYPRTGTFQLTIKRVAGSVKAP